MCRAKTTGKEEKRDPSGEKRAKEVLKINKGG